MKHAVFALALAASAGRLVQIGPVAGDGAALATLEDALAAQPDDLRAGNDYRMAVIQASQYDRAIAFFDRLVKTHPNAANSHLNYGFADVDKIPAAGAITRVILANNALGEFTRSLKLKPTWIGYYTRGNSYLYWPRVFKRTRRGVADLQKALEMQRAETKRPYHVRVFVSLGDGYWKMGRRDKARSTWKEGLIAFPEDAALKTRFSYHDGEIDTLIEAVYDYTKRVDTSLLDLWRQP